MNTADMGTKYLSATKRRTLLALMPLCSGQESGKENPKLWRLEENPVGSILLTMVLRFDPNAKCIALVSVEVLEHRCEKHMRKRGAREAHTLTTGESTSCWQEGGL